MFAFDKHVQSDIDDEDVAENDEIILFSFTKRYI